MQIFFLKVDDESDSGRTQSSCTKSLRFLQVLVALAFKSKVKKKIRHLGQYLLLKTSNHLISLVYARSAMRYTT